MKVKDPYCFHNVSGRGKEAFFLSGYLLRKYEIWSFRAALLKVLLAIPKALWIMAVTGDPQAGIIQFESYIRNFIGWMNSKG